MTTKKKLWNDIRTRLEIGGSVPTLKGDAKAEVVDILEDRIVIRIAKGENRAIEKAHIEKALDVLTLEGRVRQKNVSGNCERYVLGVMTMLPNFKSERIFDGEKNRWYLFFA